MCFCVKKEKRGGRVHNDGAKDARRVCGAQEGDALQTRPGEVRDEQVHRVQGGRSGAHQRRGGQALPRGDHRSLLRLLFAFREVDERPDQAAQRHHERAEEARRLGARDEQAARQSREGSGRSHRRHCRID